MSKQMLYIAGAIFMFTFQGYFLSNSIARNINAWEIIELTDTSIPHEFVIEQQENRITATLTNTNPTEKISVGAKFTLVKLDDYGNWRAVPFHRDVKFGAMTELAYGYSVRFSLTEDMLRTSLIQGTYRIVAEVWQWTGTQVEGVCHVWADFQLLDF